MGASHPVPADVMLSKKELAPKLRVSVRTIENWQRKRYLPFIKVANVVIFYWPTVLLSRRYKTKEQHYGKDPDLGHHHSECV